MWVLGSPQVCLYYLCITNCCYFVEFIEFNLAVGLLRHRGGRYLTVTTVITTANASIFFFVYIVNRSCARTNRILQYSVAYRRPDSEREATKASQGYFPVSARAEMSNKMNGNFTGGSHTNEVGKRNLWYLEKTSVAKRIGRGLKSLQYTRRKGATESSEARKHAPLRNPAFTGNHGYHSGPNRPSYLWTWTHHRTPKHQQLHRKYTDTINIETHHQHSHHHHHFTSQTCHPSTSNQTHLIHS